MNSLKFVKNSLKLCNIGSIWCNNNLKQQQLVCFKLAANYSTATFIRNTGGSNVFTTIHRSKDYLKLQTNAGVGIKFCQFGTKNSPDRANKSDTKSAAVADVDLFREASNLVHVVTSAGWMCGFYYLSKSGVDVPSLLQHLHLSETILEKVKSSNLGHWAIAYLCYKVATPMRYAVTLGGTTVSIKYLVQQGHIKPMPTKEEFVRMYEEQKAHRAAVKASAKKEHQPNQQNK